MNKFPNLIDWMDFIGMKELHKMHEECMKDFGDTISFSNFIEGHYESTKECWEDDIDYSDSRLVVPFNEQTDDISLETAISVMVDIINSALKEGKPVKILSEDEMVPDYDLIPEVAGDFYYKVLPEIAKTLIKLGE